MLTESDVFVWASAEPSDSEHLEDHLRNRLKSALHRARRPLRWAALLLALVSYSLPFLLFEEPLREALAAHEAPRAWLAIVILLGVSTLVISPLLGLLAHARKESSALLEAARRYSATYRGTEHDGSVRLSISTHEGQVDVLVPRAGPGVGRGEWVVYAIPEEASLGAVLVPGVAAPNGLRIGRLTPSLGALFGRSSFQGEGP